MKNKIEQKTEIAIIDEQTIRDKMYVVRGVQVMLDFELAEIYGYETKNFNRQVKNNAEKFDGEDFMFRLTKNEIYELSRCKNFTTIQTKGVKGGSAYLPYAFTEQGVYMLMTVLRGDVAIRQSRALIRVFKAMKDYIVQNQPLIDQHNYLRLSLQMTEMQKEISTVRQDLQNYGTLVLDHDRKLIEVMERLKRYRKNSYIWLYPFLCFRNKRVTKYRGCRYIVSWQPSHHLLLIQDRCKLLESET